MVIKKNALIAASLIIAPQLSLAASINIIADQITNLGASYDSSLNAYVGDFAAGRVSDIDVEYSSFYASDGLLGFDLSAIYDSLLPGQTVSINSVSINLANTANSFSNLPFDIFTSNIDADNWDESTVTFNSYYGSDYLAPWNRTTLLGSGDSVFTADGYIDPVALTITDQFQADYFDDGYLSLLIWAGDFTFTSPMEFYGADTAFEPSLSIDYSISEVPLPPAMYLFLSGMGLLSLFRKKLR